MKFTRNHKFRQRTFTYFLPSPPDRNTGYREKQFDRILGELLKLDFEIEDFKLSSLSAQKSSGVWLVFVLRPQTEKANALNLDQFQDELSSKLSLDSKTQNEIDGFYYIKDHNDDAI